MAKLEPGLAVASGRHNRANKLRPRQLRLVKAACVLQAANRCQLANVSNTAGKRDHDDCDGSTAHVR